jgi:hypothetical protein
MCDVSSEHYIVLVRRAAACKYVVPRRRLIGTKQKIESGPITSSYDVPNSIDARCAIEIMEPLRRVAMLLSDKDNIPSASFPH